MTTLTTEATSPPAWNDPVSEPVPPARPGLVRRLVRGSAGDPVWVRPAFLGLVLGTAVLYLWGLGASGWGNSFYAAAVEAGTRSWKAFFFGSFDSSNFITVDKTPASLWVMEISARIFGVNSWSILVPQALEGVGAVALLFATVKRWFGPAAGLLAGAVLALTPVAVLMFRFDNPDSLLVLLLVAAAYGLTRALESGSTGWLLLAFGCVGTGFLAKMLQAFVVVPGFGFLYLVAGPPALWRRIRQLALSAVALLVSAGWWVAIVALWPASSRPYVGGSQNNSILNLIFGYNGFGRLTGNETGSVGGGGTAGSMWGPTGWNRLFQSSMGGQVSWLIPAALILMVGGLWLRGRSPRTDRSRAAYLLWGSWLLVTGAVISFGQGIIHPYYTVALAPAIGALVGMGVVELWRRRSEIVARLFLAAATAGSAVWAFVLLGRTPTWIPDLRFLVLGAGLAAAAALIVPPGRARTLVAAAAIVAAGVGLAGPTAYALDTAATPHNGAIPSAGPATAGGGPGGGGFPGRPGGALPGGPGTGAGTGRFPAGGFPRAGFPGGGPGGGFPGAGGPGGFPTGGFPGGTTGGAPGGTGIRGGFPGGPGGGGGGAGGLLNASKPSAALVKALQAGASRYSWVAATVGSNSAAGYQLGTDDPVMSIGGFNGTDPTPTLAQFERYVAEGRIHYFIAGGGGPGGGGFGGPGGGTTTSTSSQITSWVEAHFTAQTVGGVTLYDLTVAPSS